MRIADPAADNLCNELELMSAELPLANARVLELGCGKAEKTRSLSRAGQVAAIVAMEVDAIQHARNLESSDDPKVSFLHGAAEAIPSPDAAFDIVMMFKSLHHVPLENMDRALTEIHRVLKPGGLAWISEPVFAGEMNEIMRLFHDEKIVREAAFAAVKRAVDDGRFKLERQHFFLTRSHFDSFEEFDQRMIQVTHTQHRLAPELMAAVRQKFEAHGSPEGMNFRNPNRVDVLRKQ